MSDHAELRAGPTVDRRGGRAAAAQVDGLQTRIGPTHCCRGAYPADVLAFTSAAPTGRSCRTATSRSSLQPIDVLGVNYYNPDRRPQRRRRRRGSARRPQATAAARPGQGASDVEVRCDAGAHTAMGWPIDADGLTELLVASTATTASRSSSPRTARRTTTSCGRRRSPRRRPRRLPAAHISRRASSHRRAGSTCVATSSGR